MRMRNTPCIQGARISKPSSPNALGGGDGIGRSSNRSGKVASEREVTPRPTLIIKIIAPEATAMFAPMRTSFRTR